MADDAQRPAEPTEPTLAVGDQVALKGGGNWNMTVVSIDPKKGVRTAWHSRDGLLQHGDFPAAALTRQG